MARQVPSVGMTGNIGSGKSFAAQLLKEHGAAIIDSDQLSREAVEDPEVLARIAAEVGGDLVREGVLDRKRTADVVFTDAESRRRLEGIVHPWVRARSRVIQRKLIDSAAPPPLIVHEIPLLFEQNLQGNFDAVVVVTAPLELRAAPVAARSGLSFEEFSARDSAQLSLDQKAALADHVLDNSGDREALAAQVAALWPRLITT